MASKIIIALAVIAVTVCSASGSSRIIGGNATEIENYPSAVQVEFSTIFTWTQQCAGSILNSLFILSAAHCFSGSLYSARDRRIRAGTATRNSSGFIFEILHAINHPNFDNMTLDSDITVVRLATQLTYSPTIQQATIIAPGFEFPANIPVKYIGWGLTSSTGQASHADVLQEAEVLTVDRSVCAQTYLSLPSPRNITGNMICSGLLGVGGRGACTDDAGGPLYYLNIVIGVISWGQGCALPDFPGVSTNVAAFTNWISATAT
ncbi:trypsin CFT-1-like [Plodia interpunctella]|uniref:trypsin CFT-1-like n=1 Tax=Plodia interpunctella TaxID=58824 RepID=UPI002368D807|nr:trypsin CFT-1-like [Plodia interpunctella]